MNHGEDITGFPPLLAKAPNRKRKGFNFLAPAYDLLVRLVFGKRLRKAQGYWLSHLPPANQILVLGVGTGSFLRDLEQHSKWGKVYCVDLSDSMIAASRKVIATEFPERLSNYNFLCGTVTDIPPGILFDLVITPFVLDCLQGEDLLRTMQALRQRLNPFGKWLFTDFHIPTKGFARAAGALLLRLLYVFFNTVCGLGIRRLPEFSVFFASCGMIAEEEKYFFQGLLTSRIYVPLQ